VPTIGVAIAVPEPYASQLQMHRATFGDPLAMAIPSHITLVPPTDVGDGLEPVCDHLGVVAGKHRAFRLRLRGTATFRPVSPVVFVNVTEGISSCELLANDVRQGPLGQDLVFPYHPHVTVAHHLDESALDEAYAALADYECTFDVDAFSLYVHGDDGVWRPQATFALRRATAFAEV
jgi:2'-5' RNA ligase